MPSHLADKLPVNVLTKIDNLAAVGGAELPFNLDFYTEVQDLHHLLPVLEAEQRATSTGSIAKWSALNEALISLVEDFGLLGFETLAVEDRASMASLLKAIDRASGYVFTGARGADESGRTVSDEASIWAQAMSEQWTGKMEARDVQERWIERKDEFDEEERKGFEAEARAAGALPGQSAQAVRKHAEARGAEYVEQDEGEDEMLKAQRLWEEQLKKKGEGGGAGVRVVRK